MSFGPFVLFGLILFFIFIIFVLYWLIWIAGSVVFGSWFSKPQGVRPAWWDWGMDELDPKKKNSPDEKPK